MRAEILVGRERPRRWSADDKLQIVREAFAPGARVALVARRRDVSRSQIYQWRAALREAMRYALGRWPSFTLFLDDARVAIDTNAAERAIRPISGAAILKAGSVSRRVEHLALDIIDFLLGF